MGNKLGVLGEVRVRKLGEVIEDKDRQVEETRKGHVGVNERGCRKN